MKKFWIFVVSIITVVTITGCGKQADLNEQIKDMYNVSYEEIEGQAKYSDDGMIITVMFDGENPNDDWWRVRRYVKQEDGRWHISEMGCVESHINKAVEEYRTFTNDYD